MSFSKRLLKYVGVVGKTGRQTKLVSGMIREVYDMRTGETVKVQYQMVIRNSKGQIKTTRVLA